VFIWPNKPLRIYDPSRVRGFATPTWIAQPKWDGKRVEIDCSMDGVITLYGRQGQLFPERWPWLQELPLPRPWFLDGELLRDGRIFVWDFAIFAGRYAYRTQYGERLDTLQKAIGSPVTRGGQTLACVETLQACDYETLLRRRGEPHLEGIVWKDRAATNLWGVTSTREVASCVKYRFE
jgi:ATP-dependent DNA ligase